MRGKKRTISKRKSIRKSNTNRKSNRKSIRKSIRTKNRKRRFRTRSYRRSMRGGASRYLRPVHGQGRVWDDFSLDKIHTDTDTDTECILECKETHIITFEWSSQEQPLGFRITGNNNGYKINSVDVGSVAEHEGLIAGDQIVKINDMEGLSAADAFVTGAGEFSVTIIRYDQNCINRCIHINAKNAKKANKAAKKAAKKTKKATTTNEITFADFTLVHQRPHDGGGGDGESGYGFDKDLDWKDVVIDIDTVSDADPTEQLHMELKDSINGNGVIINSSLNNNDDVIPANKSKRYKITKINVFILEDMAHLERILKKNGPIKYKLRLQLVDYVEP